MNDNKVIRLQVLDKVEAEVEVKSVQPKLPISNPIYKNMLAFHHSKIGEKLSVQDILR